MWIASVALFLLLAGIGLAWLVLSPRGALRSGGPEEAAALYLDRLGREGLREEYVRLDAPTVTEFEDAGTVAGAIFDAAAPDGPLTFREVPGSGSARAQDYILSVGGADVLLARAGFDNGWTVTPEALHALRGETRTLTVTVPEGTSLTLNGRAVGDEYVTDAALPYPDLSDLELRFDAPPHRVRYSIPGIYGDAVLEAERPGGLLLLRSDGTAWDYTLPDAGGHAFCVTSPREAVVTVCGAVLGQGDITATRSFPTRLDVPEELQSLLPDYAVYAAGGLYSEPEISAVMPDGTVLEPRETGDGLFFSLPGSEELHEQCHERVRSFLWALCDYGAGHGERGYPCAYTVNGTPLSRYIWNAGDSLVWMVGVTLDFHDIRTGDYIPLGENAFLCRGHVDVTSHTRYETKDLSLDYEMLWVKKGNYWLCQDMGFI